MATDEKKDKTTQERLGDYLLASDATINNVIKKRSLTPHNHKGKERIGEMLVEEGILTQEELENSLRKQRAQRIAKCVIFQTLSQPELFALSRVFTEISYPPDTVFIVQGDEDPSMFLIGSGLVEVFRLTNTGQEVSIATVGAGEPIGEMGYFSDGIRSSCVRTLETTHLLRAEYKNLTKYFENVPHVALAFSKIIQQRQKETKAKLSTAE